MNKKYGMRASILKFEKVDQAANTDCNAARDEKKAEEGRRRRKRRLERDEDKENYLL